MEGESGAIGKAEEGTPEDEYFVVLDWDLRGVFANSNAFGAFCCKIGTLPINL